MRPAVMGQDGALVAEQLADGKVHGATRADILRAGELLFDETVQIGFGFSSRLLMWDGDISHPAKDQNGRKRIDGERQAGTPVFDEQRDKDADHQQSIGDQIQGKLREEGGQLGHVTVDALDQFSGRMVVVEAHIKIERVPGQLGAQVVGGGPCHIFAEIFHTDRHPLLDQGDSDKSQRGHGKGPHGLASQRFIDERPHDLRGNNPQADAAEQQDSQQDKASLLRADMVRKQVPVGFKGEVHKIPIMSL